MYRLFEIAFELYDWKHQSDFMKVLSVLIVCGIIYGGVKSFLA